MRPLGLVALAAWAIALSFGCGCGLQKDQDGGGGKKAAQDPNAAVKPSFWGEERVMYAESSKWMAGRPVPDGEQWPSPPTDVDYVKFTYCGDRLVRQEAFSVSGQPASLDWEGVRREWTYAAHGGVLEEALYDADKRPTRREVFRYDDHGRCALRTLNENGSRRHQSTYTYNADGLTRTNRMELYGPDGSLINVLSEVETWNPETETWEIETGGEVPFGADQDPSGGA